MIKVNSISGGKTSVFMAPKDKGLVKYVSDKIGRDFVATAENDKTLVVVHSGNLGIIRRRCSRSDMQADGVRGSE